MRLYSGEERGHASDLGASRSGYLPRCRIPLANDRERQCPLAVTLKARCDGHPLVRDTVPPVNPPASYDGP
jgi:hypothetical protein